MLEIPRQCFEKSLMGQAENGGRPSTKSQKYCRGKVILEIPRQKCENPLMGQVEKRWSPVNKKSKILPGKGQIRDSPAIF